MWSISNFETSLNGCLGIRRKLNAWKAVFLHLVCLLCYLAFLFFLKCISAYCFGRWEGWNPSLCLVDIQEVKNGLESSFFCFVWYLISKWIASWWKWNSSNHCSQCWCSHYDFLNQTNKIFSLIMLCHPWSSRIGWKLWFWINMISRIYHFYENISFLFMRIKTHIEIYQCDSSWFFFLIYYFAWVFYIREKES